MGSFDLARHPIILRSPKRLTKESAWVEHIPFAMFLVELLRPGLLVELGTHWGDSYCAFCQAIQELDVAAQSFAVDTWQGDEHAGHYGADVLADLRAHHDDAYGSFSALIQSTFDEAVLQFEDGTIDLLHIDGYHTYEAVRHDFENWLPKMSSRGVVLFHDTNERSPEFGVWRFWAEVAQRYPHFEFVHGHGLGVICVGPDEPAALREFRETITTTPVVETLFFELGRRMRLRADLMAEQDRARSDMEYREHVISRLREEIGVQQAALGEKDRVLGIQQSALVEKDRGLDAQQAALEELRNDLATLSEVVAERDTLIAAVEEAATTREAATVALGERDASLAVSQAELASTRREIDELRQRLGYRVLEGTIRSVDKIAPWSTRRRQLVLAGAGAIRVLASEGPGGVAKRLSHVGQWAPRLWQVPLPPSPPLKTVPPEGQRSINDEYQIWLQRHARTESDQRAERAAFANLAYRPKISIILPVHDPRPEWLRDAIDSVRRQTYPNWELCLVDDGSGRETRAGIRRHALNRRMRRARLTTNQGIVAASNRALSMATGEFVGFLDHDDELKPNALFEVVRLLNADRTLDFIYSDEDKKEPDGTLVDPFFKPDWSPDLLMTVNYVTHFAVYRKELVERVGRLRPGYDGSQDHDLALRVTEVTDRIGHVPLPLYTWRKVPGSAAASPEAKPWAYQAGTLALKDSLRRRGLEADVRPGLWKGSYRVQHRIPDEPRVEIIIPTRDRLELLQRAIESIEALSTYRNYEILVVDNDSRDPSTLEYLGTFKGRVLHYPGPFNFARMMNAAAREARSEMLLFLNNDTEVITPGWIEALLEYAQQPKVGAVGARLLYPAGHVQHEGIIMGLGGGTAGNVDHGGYFSLGKSVLNATAVTAACMMSRAGVFLEVGGFEERLTVAFNDVDYCLRVGEAGYRIVYTPYAELYHYESASRGTLHPTDDEQFFRDRWGCPGEFRDPYFNPNLDPYRPYRLKIDDRQ
jgi:GT2 family glycosyltransferase